MFSMMNVIPTLYYTEMLWIQTSTPPPNHIHAVYRIYLLWVYLYITSTSMSEVDIVMATAEKSTHYQTSCVLELELISLDYVVGTPCHCVLEISLAFGAA